jgi:hypothetical protein
MVPRAMRTSWVALTLVVLTLPACRVGFQRQDDPKTGYANALECMVQQGDTAARAAELCGRRGFAPDTHKYQEGYRQALDCARAKGGSAADAAAACQAGA